VHAVKAYDGVEVLLHLFCTFALDRFEWSALGRICFNPKERASSKKVKVKWSRYRPVVAQRVGRGIALLFRDRGTGREWVVSSTPLPHFTSGKDPVPFVQKAGWAPGLVWTGGKSRPHRDSIQDRPSRSRSLYRLSHRAHKELPVPFE